MNSHVSELRDYSEWSTQSNVCCSPTRAPSEPYQGCPEHNGTQFSSQYDHCWWKLFYYQSKHEAVLVWGWSTVCDAGPTLNQHCVNVPRSLCRLSMSTDTVHSTMDDSLEAIFLNMIVSGHVFSSDPGSRVMSGGSPTTCFSHLSQISRGAAPAGTMFSHPGIHDLRGVMNVI